MLNAQWKPGDVAVAEVTGKTIVIFRAEVPNTREPRWHDEFGPLLPDDQWPHGREPRPIVVIDPEELADGLPTWALSSLLEACAEIVRDSEPNRPLREETLLRRLADAFDIPRPQPTEPAGLGAVVEDAEGRKFVRVADVIDGWMEGRQWQRIGGEVNAVRNFGWSDLRNVVRVLSEGVTP